MDYVILAMGIINIGLLVFLILKKNKIEIIEEKDNSLLEKQIEGNTEIKIKIDSIIKDLQVTTNQIMSEQISLLKTEFFEQNDRNRRGLEEFERTITDRLTSKFNQLDETMNTRIKEIQERVTKSIEGGFENTSATYKDLIAQFELINQAKENIEVLSSEVVSLKNVLENNQNRGKFGEFTLERIIYSIFGDAKNGLYAFQYPLRNYDENDRPDAVIFLPEPNKILCIDSKFPFADYKGIIEAETKEQREEYKKGFGSAVKKHITDISRKYIINNETANYALLFIPSDAIFGFINAELDNVVNYAREKNVILTSPSTLQPILATVNLVRLQVERNKNIDKIIKQIGDLNKKFKRFIEGWSKLSEAVRRLETERTKLDSSVQVIDDQFQKIEKVQGFELENKDSNND